MSDCVIISDSSCDIPDSVVEEYNIKLIPYYVSFDQENYYKERFELSIKDFYDRLRNDKVFPKHPFLPLKIILMLLLLLSKRAKVLFVFVLLVNLVVLINQLLMLKIFLLKNILMPK